MLTAILINFLDENVKSTQKNHKQRSLEEEVY